MPDQHLARALCARLVPQPGSGWRALPDSVTATTALSPDGRRVHVVHNWSWDAAAVTAPVGLRDVLTDTSYPGGLPFSLEAWDVRVPVEQ